MCDDLHALNGSANIPATVSDGDARDMGKHLAASSVDAVICSPPYPNEKGYTRTVRLESVILGFMVDKAALRHTKQRLLRSNSRGVYAGDDDDQHLPPGCPVSDLADSIEARRIALGKTSGFERRYHTVTRQYFGGMARHLATLLPALKRGARLAYVVGDQASYLRVMIRTGELLSDIALSTGYKVDGIDLFRTRLSTATGERLRAEVVLLRKP